MYYTFDEFQSSPEPEICLGESDWNYEAWFNSGNAGWVTPPPLSIHFEAETRTFRLCSHSHGEVGRWGMQIRASAKNTTYNASLTVNFVVEFTQSVYPGFLTIPQRAWVVLTDSGQTALP